jgi:hypothetical protein
MTAPDDATEAYVAELLDEAPPLDDDQAEKIGVIMREARAVVDRPVAK